MAEYSVLSFVMLIGALALTSTVPVGTNGPLLKLFWDSINLFYDSVYYVLQCSVP